jgi:hypothetical protein
MKLTLWVDPFHLFEQIHADTILSQTIQWLHTSKDSKPFPNLECRYSSDGIKGQFVDMES